MCQSTPTPPTKQEWVTCTELWGNWVVEAKEILAQGALKSQARSSKTISPGYPEIDLRGVLVKNRMHWRRSGTSVLCLRPGRPMSC